MYAVQSWLKGRKTVGIGAAMLVYLGIMAINKTEPDETVMYALLAAMGLSVGAKVDRAKNGGPPG